MPQETQEQSLQEPTLQELISNEQEQEQEQVLVPDPLQDPLEKKDPRKEQENITPNSPRFAEMTKNWREAQRASTGLQEKLDMQQKTLDLLLEHNKSLDAAVTASTTEPKRSQEPIPIDINKEIRQLRANKREAISAEEYTRVDQIEEEIEELRERKMVSKFSSLLPDVNKISTQLSEEQVARNASQAIAQFISSTSWAQKDSKDFDLVMAGAAAGVENLLMDKFPNTVIRLQEVKKQIEQRFNWKGAGIEPPMNLSVEGGGHKTQQTNAVNLTSDEESMIQRLYPDDPKGRDGYIRQKQFLAGRV